MTAEKNSMRGSDDGGYILAVLLIGMAIAAIWLTASLPAWRHQAQREKEEELIFRGEQYGRAIALFYRRNGTFPADIDTLVSQKYLRKKWKDPITNEDFNTVLAGQPAPSGGAPAGGRPPGSSGGPQPSGGPRPTGSSPQGGVPGATQQFGGGGIQGVVSKSKDTSIKIYGQQGGSGAAQQYDLWYFSYGAYCNKAGWGANCRGQQGGPGGPGGGPGGGPRGPGGPGGPGGPPGTSGGNPQGPPVTTGVPRRGGGGFY